MIGSRFFSDEFPLDRFYKWCLCFGLISHLIAVIFTEGFQRPDEHLGIIHWMGFKLGLISEKTLSWEYPAQIRPWLQPAIYALLTEGLSSIGIQNPFAIMTTLRLFSSAIAFISMLLALKIFLPYLETQKGKKIAILALFCLWFLPFFHARTTSENLSISFFIFGLALFLRRSSHLMVAIAGVIFGLTFILRYQMIFMIAPLGLWALIYGKMPIPKILPLLLGFILAQGLGALIDFWGYGEWVFPAWNYYYQNIVKGVAAGFGTDPWWYYITHSVTRGVPPLSLLLVLPTLWLWARKPKHLLTWLTLPYLAFHSMVAHKEVRFIYALAIYSPFILALLVERWSIKEFWPRWSSHIVFRVIINALLVQNFLLLIWASSRPPHSPINFYKHLYYERPEVNTIHTLNVVRDQLFFYQKNPVKMVFIENLTKAKELITQLHPPEELFFLTDSFSQMLELRSWPGCRADFYEPWPISGSIGRRFYLKQREWSLTRCQAKGSIPQ